MRAIVNVKKGSGYSKFNGLTFEVKEYFSNIVCLKIPSQLDIDKFDSVDFSISEIFITDVQSSIKALKNQIEFMNGLDEEKAPPKLVQRFKDEINFLQNYCSYKKIQI